MAQMTTQIYAPITLKSKSGGAVPSLPQTMTPGAPTPTIVPEVDTTPMGDNIDEIP